MSRYEILDQTPVSLPIHFNRQEPLHVRIMRQIRAEMEERLAENESSDDAMDFEIDEGDIEEKLTRYQDEHDFEGHFDSECDSAVAQGGVQPTESPEKVKKEQPQQ